MRIVKPSHKIMIPESPYKHIEKIGRICYKSEDYITETSAEPFVKKLYNSKHHAMLEHFRFIAEITETEYNILKTINNYKYITLTDYYDRYIVSASARGLNDIYTDDLDLLQEGVIESIVTAIVMKYDCKSLFKCELAGAFPVDTHCIRIIDDFGELYDEEYKKHAWYSIHFVCDRGISHELVRHRDASFAQESTRYCNYSKGKYNSEITVVEPWFWENDTAEYIMWKSTCEISEHTYLDLIEHGISPQKARSVLPNSLKTEIVVTAQVYEWIHILNLRYLGTTGAPHPQMKELMKPVYEQMIDTNYIKVDWCDK